jgi:hypothetical protein
LGNLDRQEWIEILKRKLDSLKEVEGIDISKQKLLKEIKNQKDTDDAWNHKRELMYIENKKEELEKEIRILRRVKEELLENKKKEIIEKLDADSNRVFEREKISEKQREILKENGYKQVNEFSVFEKRRIPVLIKPFSKHSLSHEFLVWDIKRLLEKINGVTNIKEHLTKDADITFNFNKNTYALEVELGNLLGKHSQLKTKIDQLNEKYPKRWMFIISNRNLLTKYKKFGFTSARNRLRENLSKLLKIAHT